MAAINKAAERKTNVFRPQRYFQRSAFCLFPPNSPAAAEKKKEADLAIFCPCRLSPCAQGCLHVCAYTRWGRRGDTRGFCWMSHIVPVRPGDIAGGPSGMEPGRVTVINSPFNNSCPTWPASPSQCPLCVYAYVYLCIHSMQEITTAGAPSLFFFFPACVCVLYQEGRG